MKKTLRSIASLAVAAALLAGCSSTTELPTPEKICAVAKSVGTAAGLVASKASMEDSQRALVREIVADVQKCVPATNQTFSAAWTPIAKEKTAKLTEAKKLTEAQASLVMSAFSVAVDGIDYLFAIKYPAAKTSADLVNTAAIGFCEGFLSTFSASSTATAAVAMSAKPEYDEAAYKWLSKKHAAK